MANNLENTFFFIITRKGWCPSSGKWAAVNGYICSYWVWECLMSQLCWQHAKIISPNKNPPLSEASYALIVDSMTENGLWVMGKCYSLFCISYGFWFTYSTSMLKDTVCVTVRMSSNIMLSVAPPNQHQWSRTIFRNQRPRAFIWHQDLFD